MVCLGPLLGWPASTKKLSMTESEGVQTGGKFKGTRVFEVDPAVDPSDETTMLAHLKISEGGGVLAPRVYFYDDTGGATKRCTSDSSGRTTSFRTSRRTGILQWKRKSPRA
ncbi:hypothetical protein ASG79_13760 [Arthrobacter sp. Soil761]|nr:hypothetical protein ASG79_13760 [Arthrobacter sp. Soil761]